MKYVIFTSFQRGNSALHIASLAGKQNVVELLIEKEADPNSQAQVST